jgi:predicted phosphodiesterase
MAWQSFVCASDTHGELIDRKGKNSYQSYILQWIKDHKPRWRFMLGDFIDAKAIRAGANAEDRSSSMREDCRAAIGFLRAFQPHKLTLGNHDQRLWLLAKSEKDGLEVDYARQLARQFENEFEAMGTEWVEYDVKKGWIEIGPRGANSGPKLMSHGYFSNMHPAKSMTQAAGTSTISGHTHAYDFWRQNNLAGDESYVSGCGCQIAQEYNRTHARRLKHEHSFLAGSINDRTGSWQVFRIKKDEETNTWLDPKKL